MNINTRTIDLSGLPRAIDFDAQVARNREIIKALPEPAAKQPKGYNRYSFIDQARDLYCEYFGDA
tara:strand:- start:598 stop:792 length:195 start_codon:yes stop_codon:yes gene_type:complete